MAIGGAALRFGGLFLRILQFLCAGIAIGIFSYFLSVLADRDLPIARRWQAVEGISGAGVLYTIAGILFVLCLGGKTFFGIIAIILDILFMGAFIAVAYLTRHGANSCNGVVNTPLGAGQSDSNSPGYGNDGFGFGNGENSTYFPNLHLACRLNTVVFAVSVIAAFLFLVTAIWSFLMIRRGKKDKAYGPGPNNNYTSGKGKTPFWKRNKRNTHTRDVETAGMVGTAVRPSHETGTTIGNNAFASEPKYGEAGYGQTTGYGQTPVHGHTHGHTHGHSTGQAPIHGQTPVHNATTTGNF